MLKSIFKNLFGRPATRRYPFVKREPFAGTRGQLQIRVEDCIFCGLCARRCPTDAIEVTKTPRKVWTFNRYRCIVCGYCVDACPKKCLHLNPKYDE